VVRVGMDFQDVLNMAEEDDIIIWDEGNNDLHFLHPDLWIASTDVLRPGHKLAYYPGQVNPRQVLPISARF
jgi:predicted GTPase